MSLSIYQKKRKFTKTPEPKGAHPSLPPLDKGRRGGIRFVVQEHHASHLHWDFRLELDGVLKSWAVPKGVPTKAGIKHLAVQVEDHPVEYITFHGVIPAGQYGAGRVLIWDKGTYQLLEKTAKAIKVNLKGKKLKGEFVLFKFKPKNWFLFKTK